MVASEYLRRQLQRFRSADSCLHPEDLRAFISSHWLALGPLGQRDARTHHHAIAGLVIALVVFSEHKLLDRLKQNAACARWNLVFRLWNASLLRAKANAKKPSAPGTWGFGGLASSGFYKSPFAKGL